MSTTSLLRRAVAVLAVMASVLLAAAATSAPAQAKGAHGCPHTGRTPRLPSSGHRPPPPRSTPAR